MSKLKPLHAVSESPDTLRVAAGTYR
jgi:hypothetical protein